MLDMHGVELQRQQGGSDCALFALATGVVLVPSSTQDKVVKVMRDHQKAPFDQSQMRPNLLRCLKNDKASPLPRQSCSGGGSRPCVIRYSLKPRDDC